METVECSVTFQGYRNRTTKALWHLMKVKFSTHFHEGDAQVYPPKTKLEPLDLAVKLDNLLCAL
jgi:hypothetical protein